MSIRFPFSSGLLLILPTIFLCQSARSDEAGLRFSVAKHTQSPDGRYGVTVPTMDEFLAADDDVKNVLVEVATKRPVATIAGKTGTLYEARGTAGAQWSADSKLLYWTVSGKWFESAQILLSLEDGKLAWQLDLRKAVEEAILKRTKEASPGTYDIKKAENAGNGSAYPEGFSVFIKVDDEKELRFPMKVQAFLTSNPKMSGLPERKYKSSPSNLESEMEGVVDNDGKFKTTRFKLLQKGSAYPKE